MSKKRYVDTKFWDDNYIIEKNPIEKLLFLYLLTNTLTNIIGIYEISIRRIAFDTMIDKDMVVKILKKFEEDNKVKYENGWIAIKNFTKHQLNNPKINAGIKALSREVPNNLIKWTMIDYDRLSHPNLNPNPNINDNNNPNLNKEIQEVRNQVSASLKNKAEKEKTKPNNIEFDFEGLSWHGVDDDIVADWEKRFPDINIGEQLMKIREYFKINPDEEKYIKNYAIYINDWLTRADKYRIADNNKEGGN